MIQTMKGEPTTMQAYAETICTFADGKLTIRLAPCPVIECSHATWEETMAKGQMKGNKEAKKPKADKPKSGGSAYKLSQGAGGQAISPPSKRK